MTICTWTRWPLSVERNLKGVAGLSDPQAATAPLIGPGRY